MASRVETEIQVRLSNEPNFAIHQFMEKDISAYVTSRLGQAWDLMARQPDGTKAVYDWNLVDMVGKKAEGVFVWVKIVASQLAWAIEEEVDSCDLYSLLDGFPEGLEDLYSSILDKIDQKLWPDTIIFLLLLMATTGIFTLGGCVNNLLVLSGAIQDPMSAVTCKAYFEAGFAIDDASLPHNQCAEVKRRLQRSCRGLIEIGNAEDLPSSRVALLHLTVGEYLSKSPRFEEMLDKVDKRLLRDPAVAIMAMFLRFLKCYPQYRRRSSLIEDFFAAVSSAERSTAISQTAYVEELDRVLSLTDRDWTTSYYRSLRLFDHSSLRPDILSLAVYHGLAFYLQHQIGTNGKGIIQRARGRPLLFYAVNRFVREMHYDGRILILNTFEILLNNGAEPMETFRGRTPWSHLVTKTSGIITRKEHAKLFKVMLEHGADPTERVSINVNDYREAIQKNQYTTTFHMLLRCPRQWWSDENERVVKSLIDHCNDLEATDSDGIGIQDWADSMNPEIGAFLRQEIAAKNQRKRRRKH